MTLPANLEEFVDAISPLRRETWDLLRPLFVRRELDRGEHFATVGKVQIHLGLLESGWVRAYYPTPDGAEYNKHLFRAPAVIGDYASLLTGETVRLPQQALTQCVVWAIPYRRIDDLTRTQPDVERLARRYAELTYIDKERRELEIVTLDAGRRYELLLSRYPDIEQAVPLYQIASYLGITPTQLSRVRKRKRSSRPM